MTRGKDIENSGRKGGFEIMRAEKMNENILRPFA
jgi:hypothetical protein